MKTNKRSAEEWIRLYDEDQRRHIETGEPRKLKHSTGDYVRAIQHDAREAALREAAEHVKSVLVETNLSDSILSLIKPS